VAPIFCAITASAPCHPQHFHPAIHTKKFLSVLSVLSLLPQRV
jgi:hypothetical protein